MTFKEFLLKREGLFINDQSAEDGKSRPKKPPQKGLAVTPCGAAGGGPGPCATAGGMAPMAAPRK